MKFRAKTSSETDGSAATELEGSTNNIEANVTKVSRINIGVYQYIIMHHYVIIFF